MDINKLINHKIERALENLKLPTEKLSGQIPGGILPPASETPYASGTPDFSDITGTLSDTQHGERTNGNLHAVAQVGTPGFVSPDGTSITINGSGVISSTAGAPDFSDITGTLSDAQHGTRGNGNLHDVATVGTPGFVSPDGTSITINGSGVLSLPTQAVKPAFQVTKNNTDQTGIVRGSFTPVSWFAAEINRNGDFNLAGNRFQPTYPSSEIYLLSATITIHNPEDRKRYIVSIIKNGSEIKRFDTTSSGGVTFSLSVTVRAEANGTTDYFQVYLWHDASVNQIINGDSRMTYFSGNLI